MPSVRMSVHKCPPLRPIGMDMLTHICGGI